ncbi:glycoside hydrolase N-terminal domain-containing protein [Leifsonia sp. F6_8S_P_1B]|uniref:Glycoside hydrolase N-terminal domain-containing protein n=1 Tax=Leifsonia williamsii TaxID=3035919 RepID=A0ABT8K9A7_9MICO|nr:glycoside hydrolase N-terminal domain-containing protein [Leifsonia williamsii]MDN4614046.1 glycoside hydrolase N-terminal domain-containing protein [Leifsonia williamsii]
MTARTLQLAWREPARHWEEALPIGDGRLGAMVFGGADGRYQVNDATVWSGTPDGPAEGLRQVLAAGAGPERLREVREALAAGDLDRAEALLLTFEGRYSQEFLPFVDLVVGVPGAVPVDGEPARVLDLDRAVVEEALQVGAARVTRTSWVAGGVLLVSIASDEPLQEVRLALSTPLRSLGVAAGDGVIALDVAVPVDGAPLHEPSVVPALRYAEPGDGYDGFAAAALAVRSDGTTETDDSGLTIRRARRLLIALSSSTRAESWWAGADDEGRTVSPETIRDRATARALDAVAGGAEPAAGDAPRHPAAARFAIGGRRDGRWDVEADVLRGGDDALRATIAAEYGRYLLHSSSRAGNPAANLQGIWNGELRPAWSSNYTININTQMNYWAAGPLGLTADAEPQLALVERMAATGRDVARELYGARGWVAHHNSDLWGWSLPVGMGRGAPSWAIWMMGGVWLCHSLWDHYEFSGDTALLRDRLLPLLRGATEFCLDWMQVGDDGEAVFAPSTSPENTYRDAAGTPRALGLTATADRELVRGLFRRTLVALEVLGIDDPLRREVEAALAVIPEPGVGSDGRLLEWSREVPEHEPAHRHLSPLVGLYPLDLITPDGTPALAEASRRFLDARGDGAMGWSWAWKIALRARLGDGETAHELLQQALTPYDGDARRHGPVDGSEWGGLLPNLFSTHPPFQIDGNLGFSAAIAELLLQSHTGVLHLLPALPAAWPEGRVDGLGARGGLTVDLAWSAGRLEGAVLRNPHPEPRDVRVRLGADSFDVCLPANGEHVVTDPPQQPAPTPTPTMVSGQSQ